MLVGMASVFASAQDYSVRPVNNCVNRGGLDSAYQQCVREYQNQLNQYNMFQTRSTGLQQPTLNVSSCTLPDGTQNGTCVQQAQARYQSELQYYNTIKQQEIEAQRQRELTQARESEAARQAAQRSQQANKDAKSAYQLSQLLSAVTSVVSFSMCTPASPTPCILGAFMAAQSLTAGNQKNVQAEAARMSCETGNSYGATQVQCGSSPPVIDNTRFPFNTEPPLNEIVDNNGNCTGSAELCNDILRGLPPGTTLNDLSRGLSAFASGKPPAKIDKDGNISTNDGKKYPPGSLDEAGELQKAGLSPDQAKALLAAMGKSMGGDAAGAAKAGTGLDSLAGLDGLGGEDAGAKAGGIGGAGNGEADGSELDADKNKRKIAAAEGLAKDFNGELIGVAGDDIFKMMNRRYVLKVKQDSFMAP